MSNQEILEKAIQKAIEGGWKATLEGNILKKIDETGKFHLWIGANTWGSIDLIFNHEFAKALWGNDVVTKDAVGFGIIKIWAEQVAYEFEGRLHAANGKRQMAFLKYPDNMLVHRAPNELVEVEKVVMDLKHLAGSIPFRTHKIKEVDVLGGIPTWQYHLQQMVIADDPIKYLGENI